MKLPGAGVQTFVADFAAFEKSLNGESNAPVHELRKKALSRFGELGFPTRKDEEWRFTNITPITKTPFRSLLGERTVTVNDIDVRSRNFGDLASHRIVMVNGVFVPRLSSIGALPPTVRAGSLADLLRSDWELVAGHLARHATFDNNAFTALGTAFLRDGFVVIVPDGAALDKPFHIMYFATEGHGQPFAVHPRNLIVTGRESNVSVVESYFGIGHGVYLTNTITEIVIGENASLEHDKYQQESDTGFHIANTHVLQGANSRYVSNAISLGASIVRNNHTVVFEGEGCDCTLNGLSLGTAGQLIDNHTTIDHARPRCSSHELYKSILDGKSRGVFNGKIYVRKDAQKTDAKQTNKTLLLSDHATIDTKPQLEIFADDVKCTHGATVGQLDEEQVFYLRSRGIPEETARDILTFAFARDVIERVHVAPLREQLDMIIRKRLQHGRNLQA